MTSNSAAPPLDQPLYGATFAQAFTRFFRNYANFAGRASRSEFWWVALTFVIWELAVWSVLGGTLALASTGERDFAATIAPIIAVTVYLVSSAVSLGAIVPWLALMWRRLHDTNKSGAFAFFVFIPLVGGIILIVFLLLPSDPAGAAFDSDRATVPVPAPVPVPVQAPAPAPAPAPPTTADAPQV